MIKNKEDQVNTIIDHVITKWDDEVVSKVNYAYKGLKWLGLLDDFDHLTFLNNMVKLGQLLSEDKSLKEIRENNKMFNMSLESAVQKRNQLTSDPKWLSAINDKMSLNHKSALDQLQQLNKIIATYKTSQSS